MASTSIKAIIGPVRFSYLHVFEPWKAEGDEKEPKFTATLLIDKKNTKMVEEVRKSIKAAYKAAVKEKWGGKEPKDGFWFDPLQDGDEPKQDGEERGEAYKGHWFINAKCSKQPGVIDRHHKAITDSRDFYSGCFGLASVGFSGFTFGKKMGISCFLNNLMMTDEGDPLGGVSTSAEEDFAGFDFGDEDEDDDLM